MFYLAVVQKTTGGNTQALWAKDTLDEAMSAFHYELSYRGEERMFTACTILNECCAPVKSAEYWQRPEA